MFKPMTTKLREIIAIPPSELGCVESSVLTSLHRMYIDISCPKLGIGLEINSMRIESLCLDPDDGSCNANVVFELKHVVPRLGDIIKKPAAAKQF